MADETSHNPTEKRHSVLTDGADHFSGGADQGSLTDSKSSKQDLEAAETVIQSEASMMDATLLESEAQETPTGPVSPGTTDALESNRAASHVSQPIRTAHVPDRQDGDARADWTAADSAAVSETADTSGTAAGPFPIASASRPDGADGSLPVDSRAPTISRPAPDSVTADGPARSGEDAALFVEETIVAPEAHPSATAPANSEETGEEFVTVEHTASRTQTVDTTRGSSGESKSAATTIGRFEIQKVLGQGAFGTVYLAYDPHLDRKVAIKVAKTGVLSGRQDVDRFLREARSAAQLRHPNIIPVYEFERLPHSSFIAYEFVEGRTLGDLLKERHKLTCEEAAGFIAKLASALDYAHSLGIVHRDMKPENVLLDRDGEPHIADFGLARRDDGDTLRTREGMFMGTPSYMSPEQAGGKAHMADGRSDIWSLGVMLHEMLTGARPFRGTVTEVLVAVQHDEPPPLRQIDTTIPRDVETICQKALAKDPQQRYQRAQELADELERWRHGVPILARPISLPHRAWRWARRHPDLAGLLGALLATFLIATIVSSWFGIAATRSEQRMREARAARALTQLQALGSAVPASVPVIIDELMASREEIAPQLELAIASPDLSGRSRTRMLLARAILQGEEQSDPFDATDLTSQLLDSDAPELTMLTELIRQHGFRSLVETPLWLAVQREGSGSPRRFRALAALAALNSRVPEWSRVKSDLVAEMLTMDPIELAGWLPALRPIRQELEGPLTEQFLTADSRDVRVLAATVLAELFHDSLEKLVELIPQANPAQLAPLLVALRKHQDAIVPRLRVELQSLQKRDSSRAGIDDRRAAQITNLGVALLKLDQADDVWALLSGSPDREVRSRLIHAAPLAGVPWRMIARRLEWDTDPQAQAALCLMLGEYSEGDLLPGDRDQLVTPLLDRFAGTPDAGVHAAAEWTLRKWGKGAEVDQTRTALQTAERVPERQWHIDPQGWTFTIFDGPTEFDMGSEPATPHHQANERRHRRLIPRTFGIASHEVTVADYLRFREEHPIPSFVDYAPEPDCPVVMLNWIDAVMYCRWLSEQAGIDEREMCYPPLDVLEQARKKFDASLPLPDDLLDRTGYRLPTAAEWEYACRSETQTAWGFGNSEQLLSEYAWYEENAHGRTAPVGQLKPNDSGLFDVHGNAIEWCHSYYFDEYVEPSASGVVVDGVDARNARGSERELRGGGILRPASNTTTAFREHDLPRQVYFDVGFRVARTYRIDSSP